MKLQLIYLSILSFVFLKGDDHCFLSIKQMDVSNSAHCCYQHNNISNSTHKRSPADLFALTACCDDDDDTGSVKKKAGLTVSLLSNDVFEEIFACNELKRTQQFSKYSTHDSQPVYIFQKELLI